MAKISIIVPVYNAEKYIATCLNSLKNQTYQNIEILCINDGSNDNSLNILQEFAQSDSRIIVLSQENSGPATARNYGLNSSTGKYIMFCDSDDTYQIDMCEKMINTIIKENVDIVMCSYNIIRNSDLRESESNQFYMKFQGYSDINQSLYKKISGVLWNKILKKEIIQKYQIRFPDGYEHDDINFVWKYLSVSNSYFGLNENLYNYYIVNPNSIMSKYTEKRNVKNRFDFAYALHDLSLFLISNSVKKEYLKAYKSIYNDNLLWHCSFLNDDEIPVLISIINEQLKDITLFDDIKLIKNIKSKNLEIVKRIINNLNNDTLLEKIFSLKNKKDTKILTILGIKFYFERRRK